MTERERDEKAMAVIREVIELMALRYGERADQNPGLERGQAYLQLAVALTLKAAGNKPKLAVELFHMVLGYPAMMVGLKQIIQ